MNKYSEIFKIIKIPKIEDNCSLFFAEVKKHIPFSIKRVYFITKANTKLPRGSHAHYKNQQVLFCINGSITINLDNGIERKKIKLKSAGRGVFIDKMVWHEMLKFKKDTILLVLASHHFNLKDYIRDYNEFSKLISNKNAKK